MCLIRAGAKFCRAVALQELSLRPMLYTQSALQSCGGSLLNHHQCAVSTWMMRRLPRYNGASALATHQLQVERRESHRQSSGWGLLGLLTVDIDFYRTFCLTGYQQLFGLGVDRLSVGILSIFTIIDIGHFQNRLTDNFFILFFIMLTSILFTGDIIYWWINTKHLKYFSLCGMNVYIIQVSLFEWN